MIAFNSVLGHIEPETLDRKTLVRVMQMRDFRPFSPDMIKRLTLRAEEEFGRKSPNRPVFELPFWEKRLHVHFQQNRSEKPSYLETNLMLMAKIRYFQWMHEYDSASRIQKAEMMKDMVAEMTYWQTIYFDYLRSLDLPEPTLTEQAEDFQRMIDHFKKDASPEEIVNIDRFARDMKVALFSNEMPRFRIPGIW